MVDYNEAKISQTAVRYLPTLNRRFLHQTERQGTGNGRGRDIGGREQRCCSWGVAKKGRLRLLLFLSSLECLRAVRPCTTSWQCVPKCGRQEAKACARLRASRYVRTCGLAHSTPYCI
eukprot:365490-Chlamydomonas_euryale.AAC.4